jgi:hypothetical protein
MVLLGSEQDDEVTAARRSAGLSGQQQPAGRENRVISGYRPGKPVPAAQPPAVKPDVNTAL